MLLTAAAVAVKSPARRGSRLDLLGLFGLLRLLRLRLLLLRLGGRRLGLRLRRRRLRLLARLRLAALQPGGVGGLGEGLDAAVKAEVAAVEGRLVDALAAGGLGQLLADRLRRLDVAAVGH